MHGCTVLDNEVSGGGIHGIARDAGRVTRTLVIVAQVQQTAAFHIDRAGAGNAVVLDRQFIQNQMAALFNDDQRLICRSIGNKTAAMEDQCLTASNSQRGTGTNRVGNGDIGDVRA